MPITIVHSRWCAALNTTSSLTRRNFFTPHDGGAWTPVSVLKPPPEACYPVKPPKDSRTGVHIEFIIWFEIIGENDMDVSFSDLYGHTLCIQNTCSYQLTYHINIIILKACPAMDAAVMSFHLSLSPTSSSSLTRFRPEVMPYNVNPALFRSFAILSIHGCFVRSERQGSRTRGCRAGGAASVARTTGATGARRRGSVGWPARGGGSTRTVGGRARTLSTTLRGVSVPL